MHWNSSRRMGSSVRPREGQITTITCSGAIGGNDGSSQVCILNRRTQLHVNATVTLATVSFGSTAGLALRLLSLEATGWVGAPSRVFFAVINRLER